MGVGGYEKRGHFFVHVCYNFFMKHTQATRKDHKERINEVLYYIHAHLHEALDVQTLSSHVAMSVFHFNRVFKELMGESVHAYVKRVKLEHVANLLLFNPEASITHCMHEVGLSSSASLTQAFKERFGVTPTKWREIDRANENPHSPFTCKDLHVTLQKMPSFYVAYVRHTGYDRSIKEAWLKLQEWAFRQKIVFENQTMLGLHHSNPRFVAPHLCHYVACLELPEHKQFYRSGEVGVMHIPQTFCAVFSLKGVYGDLKKYMDVIYHEWLPKSPYEKIALPSFALYEKNHFLEPDEHFVLQFCIPVRAKE